MISFLTLNLLRPTCRWTALQASFSITSNSSDLPIDIQTSNVSLATPVKPIILSGLAQRAIWASKIIKMISESSLPTSLALSLRDQLMNMSIDTTLYNFEME
jgi:predicted permease